MKPGKYYFSEPFISWFGPMVEARVQREAAIADGTYVEPVPAVRSASSGSSRPQGSNNPHDQRAAAVPRTDKQVWKLKQLGYSGDLAISKYEASALISQLLEEQDEARRY